MSNLADGQDILSIAKTTLDTKIEEIKDTVKKKVESKANKVKEVVSDEVTARINDLNPKIVRNWIWWRHKWTKWSTKIRILISFVQVLTPLGVVYSIPFPSAYDSLMRWLNVFDLNLIEIMPLACIFNSTYHTTLLLRTLLPMLALAIIFAIRKFAMSRGGDKFYDWVAEGSVTVAFFLLLLIYPSTSQNIFYAFQCLSIDDGRSLLRSDLSIDCDSTTLGLLGVCPVYGSRVPSRNPSTVRFPHVVPFRQTERAKAH